MHGKMHEDRFPSCGFEAIELRTNSPDVWLFMHLMTKCMPGIHMSGLVGVIRMTLWCFELVAVSKKKIRATTSLRTIHRTNITCFTSKKKPFNLLHLPNIAKNINTSISFNIRTPLKGTMNETLGVRWVRSNDFSTCKWVQASTI